MRAGGTVVKPNWDVLRVAGRNAENRAKNGKDYE
jgi:hypothetical protein